MTCSHPYNQGMSAASTNPRPKSQAHHKAELRTALVAAVGEETIHRLAARLIVLARHGDMNAAKLLLDYAIGKRLETDVVSVEPVDYEAQRAERMRMLMDEETLKRAAELPVIAGRALARFAEEERTTSDSFPPDDEPR